MLKVPRPQPKRQPESTLALINIVFLLLIFFLIAGTLAPPIDQEVRLINAAEPDPAEPPDALAVLADGTLRFRGVATDIETHIAMLREKTGDGDALAVRLFPDKELPAEKLIDIAADLRKAGAGSVRVVTERGGQQ